MAAQFNGVRFSSAGGSTMHTVIDETGKRLGWVSEVFEDVFYVKHISDLYKDNRRFRRIEDALKAFDKE